MKEVINVNNNNIRIENNKVYIDDIEYVPKNKDVDEVEFKGDVGELKSGCGFTINGDVNGNVSASIWVTIKGNVVGDIDCGDSVSINGYCRGNIDAGGSVWIKN